MFGPKIKLDRDLHARLTRVAGDRGYASVEEFVVHLLEQAVANDDRDGEAGAGADAEMDAEVEKQLRGLGYIE